MILLLRAVRKQYGFLNAGCAKRAFPTVFSKKLKTAEIFPMITVSPALSLSITELHFV